MRRRLIIGVLCALGGGVGIAQQPATPLRFEVASIRPSKSDLTYAVVPRKNPDRYALTNASLLDLIRDAFSVRELAVAEGPDWIRRERFDVMATAPESQVSQHRRMLQTLLSERFALRVHRETRQVPVYELVKARSDGRLGPNLKATTADCSQVKCYMDSGVAAMRGISVPWPQILANGFADLDRPLIDKSGLSGSFDIDFLWAPLDASDNRPEQVIKFTAVQEQLGLRLQPAVGPVEQLVIDSAERPTPD
jgi:uncharacterized protein (TIGR03435 family)